MAPHNKEPIAVIGSACRFAGDANSPSKLWELLQKPGDLRQKIPDSRFNADAWYHPDGSYHGHSNVKHAYLLNEDVGVFDAEFFGIKHSEAKAMDPQQRMLMEVAYESLESAGLALTDLKGSDTAVYVGVMFQDYTTMLLRDMQEVPTYFATGTGTSILSNRISYFFDLHGPSVTIDTACSSSLVAVHMAVQALRNGESRVALACGSNLILDPSSFIIESKMKMLSPNGRSRMWDQGADGYARGEGIATVVLKSLSAALEDGDHIECIIRETGLNQDGATGGITMPSPSAQEALIRSTYAKAGLDLLVQADRPQYFEAHGTGTPAGDPVEAEAIFRAFNAYPADIKGPESKDPLYVGSIKTVLGHTEGTAGIAALLKASLSLQHSRILPNRLFENLSDRVAPFYKNVEILDSSKPWPEVAGTRRASVNSFGFGGANAHAILENFVDPAPKTSGAAELESLYSPFVFSAHSEQSLRANLHAWKDFLSSSQSVDIVDLLWTLQERRTAFNHRTAIAASSLESLRDKIVARLEDESANIGIKALPPSKKRPTRVLGIFTGQGAQYPRMGAELIEQSQRARDTIRQLDSYLAQLPDGPSWSLEAEILAEASVSRINEAHFSQSTCTAVQILLVDMLQFAGVELNAVVGHSSGEIAAAYAAGILSARDAICIAYYRGLHVGKAASPKGDIKGAMIAVGSSMEDILELCEDETLRGRISVAASNSPSSITVSGDEDAITELQEILEDEGKFNRRLKVDKAYHSQHMLPCYGPYVESLKQCGIKTREPKEGCTWFSSVYNRPVDSDMHLADVYWADNMTKPVLFSEALTSALLADSYDLVLELGAHSALKGPATQTVEHVLQKSIPYQGLLTRGVSSVEASSSAMGFIWSQLPIGSIRLHRLEQSMQNHDHKPVVIKQLPKYQWNHSTRHWHESRASRKMLHRQSHVHGLLGDITSDSAPHCMSWRNLFRQSEMEWVSGHRVQGQVVFPAAGYLTLAIEASRVIAGEKGFGIRLIDIQDFVIHQAVPFSSDDAGIEALTSMADIVVQDDCIRAKYTFSASLDTKTDDLTLIASAEMDIRLGEMSEDLLPSRKPAFSHAVDVEPDRFYAALSDLGYNFGGRFKSLSGLRRKYYEASCQIKAELLEEGADDLLIHPAEFDASLQSIILAYSHPYDEELRSLHLPTGIRHIRINPALLGATNRTSTEFYTADSTIIPRKPGQRGISGEVNLYSNKSSSAAIQIQGAEFLPLGGAEAEEDRRLFSSFQWISDRPSGVQDHVDLPANFNDMVLLLERIATFYLRQFHHNVPDDHPARSEFTTKWYLNFAKHIIESGCHKWAQKEWLNDQLEDIMAASKPYMHLPDVEIMHLIGRSMPRVFNEETTILEELRANDVLDRYYAGGFGLGESARWVGRTVKQVTDRYPHMNILEIGAGTGGATKHIFSEIGQNFRSYTYTDLSAAFFQNASTIFSEQRDRMIFKTLDVEKDPITQSFTEGSYDLIVAFFIIHAVSDVRRALRHLRKLLRPGGYLIIGEGQHSDTATVATSGFIFGTLQGWWYGASEGRKLSPYVSPQQWNSLLIETGFSGFDAQTPKYFEDTLSVCHFASQAVNEEVKFYRDPTTAILPSFSIKSLVIVGGHTERSSRIVRDLGSTLKPYAGEIVVYPSLLDVDYSVVDGDSTVVSFTELDRPIFKDITPELFNAFKKMFERGGNLLWVTSGRRDDEPFSNMTVGWGRVAVHEIPDLRLQQLDIEEPQTVDCQVISEILLRHCAAASKSQHLLWSEEPEIALNSQGVLTLPRLRPVQSINDRYMSARRAICQERDAKNLQISVQPKSTGWIFREQSRYESLASGALTKHETIKLKLTSMICSALRTPLGYRFLVMCEEINTKLPYMVLVSKLDSSIEVPKDAAIGISIADASNSDILLVKTAAQLVAFTTLQPLHAGQKVLAHNVPEIIAGSLDAQAAAKKIHVQYTTDSSNETLSESWIRLPQYVSHRDLDQILRVKPAAFIGLSGNVQQSDNEATIASILPSSCSVHTAKTLFATDASEADGNMVTVGVLGDILSTAVNNAIEETKAHKTPPAIEYLRLADLANGKAPQSVLAVTDWKDVDKLSIHAARIDSSDMFRGVESTYWILGMSGALGISTCDWMISRGARNIVVTSRNPDISPEWIAAHKRQGANVAVLACDATNEAALKSVHQKIVDTMPPIAGVMNGAMVLRDTLIRKMTFNELTDVLGPKVLGSIHLDRIFHDVDLDFFVLVASINCVIGNVGQANYGAANTFMNALTAQRRKRGLRAATVNGGAIVGAGYMQRESRRQLDLIVRKLHMMRMSEEDWNQSICEAIDASRLDSITDGYVTAGIADVSIDAAEGPYWLTNPMLSAFVIANKANAPGTKNELDKTTQSVQSQLAACKNLEEAHAVVEKTFAIQLRSVLQRDVPDADLMAASSSEIGLDSLVSVDIRSWFLKNLQVSVPVLKILGNDTMASIAQYATDNIPAELLPEMFNSDNGSNLNDSEEPLDSASSDSDAGPVTETPASELYGPSGGGILASRTTSGKIDWEAEARPSPELNKFAKVVDPVPVSPPKFIVLTGATGLLGHHLVEYLLERTSVEKIFCLAVRNLAGRKQKGELSQDRRVEYFEGALADPLLGLSEEEAKRIFGQADVVIHNGADTSHLKYFADLRASNVGSTKTLAQLCLPRRIPMHYVSSAGLAVLYQGTAFPATRVTGRENNYPADDGTFGYMCSKWTNERFLEQVHDLYGLPVAIHRPSTIMREGEDAEGTRAQLDWVNALLSWSEAIGAAPLVENNRGALDLVRISTACESILSHILDDSEKARVKVTYAHQTGDVVLPLRNLKTIGIELGRDSENLEVLPMSEWIEKAVKAGLHPAIAALIEIMDVPGAPDYPRILRGSSKVVEM